MPAEVRDIRTVALTAAKLAPRGEEIIQTYHLIEYAAHIRIIGVQARL